MFGSKYINVYSLDITRSLLMAAKDLGLKAQPIETNNKLAVLSFEEKQKYIKQYKLIKSSVCSCYSKFGMPPSRIEGLEKPDPMILKAYAEDVLHIIKEMGDKNYCVIEPFKDSIYETSLRFVDYFIHRFLCFIVFGEFRTFLYQDHPLYKDLTSEEKNIIALNGGLSCVWIFLTGCTQEKTNYIDELNGKAEIVAISHTNRLKENLRKAFGIIYQVSIKEQ